MHCVLDLHTQQQNLVLLTASAMITNVGCCHQGTPPNPLEAAATAAAEHHSQLDTSNPVIAAAAESTSSTASTQLSPTQPATAAGAITAFIVEKTFPGLCSRSATACTAFILARQQVSHQMSCGLLVSLLTSCDASLQLHIPSITACSETNSMSVYHLNPRCKFWCP